MSGITVEHEDCSYTIRVTGGELGGSHMSVYACEECAPAWMAAVRREYDNVEVVDLPIKH